jgi:ice-binding like protein
MYANAQCALRERRITALAMGPQLSKGCSIAEEKTHGGVAVNSCQKYFSACLLALLSQAAFAQAPTLGAASAFSVLGGTAVTCTTSVITGDVGVSPGTAFTNTGCTIAGGMPPATNVAAAGTRNDFIIAYTALQSRACDFTLGSTIPASTTLVPGVYCIGAALTATDVTLTLDASGNANAVWIFKIGAALTGTNFSVVMANGGQPCNVFWAPSAGVTMTTSALKGNILAGGDTGSITLTGGSLAGRALANVAVTMTNASIIGCAVLSGALACKANERLVCKVKRNRHDRDREDDDDDDDDDDGKDRGHKRNPFGSKKGK